MSHAQKIDLQEELSQGFAGRYIRRKGRQLLGHAGLRNADRLDVEQNLSLALFRAFANFKPESGHWRAFAATVVERRADRLLKRRKAKKRDERRHVVSFSAPVQNAEGETVELGDELPQETRDVRVGRRTLSDIERFELVSDVNEVVAQLPPQLERICRKLVHTFTTKRKRRYRYYTCTKAIQEGRRRCPSRSLPALELDEAVVDEIRCHTKDRSLRRDVLRQAQEQCDAEVAALRTEHDDLKRELVRYQKAIRTLLADTDSGGPKATELADINEQIARAESRVGELDAQIPLVAAGRLERKDINAALGDFDGLWAALSPREQARVLGLLIARIEFDAEDGSLAMTFHPAGIKILPNQAAGAASWRR